MKQDIYIKIQGQDGDSLFEIPDFVFNWEYNKKERACYPEELGKIVTPNFNFRFYKEVVKIHA